MVFPIRASMKDISSYRKIYGLTMVIVFLICSVFGFLSYLVDPFDTRPWETRCLLSFFMLSAVITKFFFCLKFFMEW
jgi:hypothetical protein